PTRSRTSSRRRRSTICSRGCAACRAPPGTPSPAPEMRITRLDLPEVERLGGPARGAGAGPALDSTRRFDTAGAEPRSLRVTAEELDEAIKNLPLDVVAGLQVAITNVALVAAAGVGADVAVDLPQGQRIVLRELPVSSAAVY